VDLAREGEGDGPRLHHLAVTRRARYAVLGEPGSEVRELWIVLHGYRQLAARFLRRFGSLAGPERLFVAPEALNRFYLDDAPGRHGPESRVGATWMTREDRDAEIQDYVEYLDRLRDRVGEGLEADVRTVGLGFSQGCHTLARWAALGRTDFHALVFWGEVLPPDLDLEAARAGFGTARLLSVQGRADAHLTPELLARQDRQMEVVGRPLELHWHEGGHRLEGPTLARVGGLLER
jgi:predicted esterase